MFNEGISAEGNILDVGVEFDIVKKAGSWYSYGDEKLGQGRPASIKILKSNEKMCDKIEKEIMLKVEKGTEVPLEVGSEENEQDEGGELPEPANTE